MQGDVLEIQRIHKVWINPLNAWVNEVLAGVGVDRNDRHVIHHHRFGLSKQTVTRLACLGLRCAFQNNLVVNIVGVTGIVIAAVGNKEV